MECVGAGGKRAIKRERKKIEDKGSSSLVGKRQFILKTRSLVRV